MTHSNSITVPVVQYGFADDESDDEDCRGGFLGGMMRGSGNKHPCENGGKGIGARLHDSFMSSFSHSSQRGGLFVEGEEKEDATKTTQDDDEDDDDSDSDSSRESVAQKASKALKSIGSTLLRRKSQTGVDDDDDSSSSDEEDSDSDDDDDDDDEEEMGGSVSSFASRTLSKVTGGISTALRLGRRSDDESDSEEEEDPLSGDFNARSSTGSLPPGSALNTGSQELRSSNNNRHSRNHGGERRRSNEREAPSMFKRSMTSDVGNSASSGRYRRSNTEQVPNHANAGPGLRRVSTEQVQPTRGSPRRSASGDGTGRQHRSRNRGTVTPKAAAVALAAEDGHTLALDSDHKNRLTSSTNSAASSSPQPTKVRPNRQRSRGRTGGLVTPKAAAQALAAEEGHALNLPSDHHPGFNPQAQYGGAAPAVPDWSMNVTEAMLEQAMSDAEDENGRKWKMNVPKNLLKASTGSTGAPGNNNNIRA